MIGTVFIPLQVEAGFLSSVLGDQVYASTASGVLAGEVPLGDSNSQNISILEANVTSASVFLSKNGKEKEEENTGISNDTSVFVSDNALVPNTTALGGSGGAEAEQYSLEEIERYVVRSGDTTAQIAKMFDVTTDTIISFNDLTAGVKLKEGDVLLIPPFSGVEHTVTSGESLQSIANKYGISVNKIIDSNIDLASDTKLAIGEKLIIPGASMRNESKKASGGSTKKVISGIVKSSSGYFINPLPSGPRIRKTQGIHDKYAIDIGAPTGTPIYAAASGTVTFAKMGWNGAYGNAVFIKHPNGTETRYAHMSKVATSTGAKVSQGEIIGYVGSTGRSTGPHLHYEVRGATNNLR